MDIKEALLRWFINFLIKNSSSKSVKNEIIFNEELVKK